jgi:hypothetical protein
MKAREVRAALQGKVEPQLVHCMCEIAEIASAQQQEIDELAKMLNKAFTVMMQLGATVEGATNAVDTIRKQREG